MNKFERTRQVQTQKGGPGGRGRGRPPKFVVHNGKAVLGLSYHRKSQRFYATSPCVATGTRIYFGYEIDKAVRAYRRWKRKQRELEAA